MNMECIKILNGLIQTKQLDSVKNQCGAMVIWENGFEEILELALKTYKTIIKTSFDPCTTGQSQALSSEYNL